MGEASRLSESYTVDRLKSALSPGSPANRKKNTLAKAVIAILVRLIEGQRQLADEFGLSSGRVFPNSFELLDGQNPQDVLIDLFRSGPARIDELEGLFEDLISHQLALVSALDDVALAAMKRLSPEQLKEGSSGRWLSDARAWRLYKKRHRELMDNDNIRFQHIVGAGFVEGYSQARKRNNAKFGRTGKRCNTKSGR